MSRAADLAVNGRFLTKPVTGVQRYARNVIAAMNTELASIGETAPIIVPGGAPDPGLPAMPLVTARPLSGHAWEQLVLPVNWAGRLLNLCNTAPALKAEQIVCLHDASVFDAPESFSGAFRRLYAALTPSLVRRSACIATVSAYSASRIAHHLPIAAGKIVVLPNGHEHALGWNPALAEIAPAQVATAPGGFVLAIGSRARHKNLGLLVELAPDLALLGLEVFIVGGGAGIFAKTALQAAPNVRLIDGVTDHDLAYFLDRALCLAFPSWTEGFGLPIVEAMARGCPVVSSDRASMPEVCGEAALMAAPDDPETWLKHIAALHGSPALGGDLAEAGRAQIRRFSWAETAAGFLDLATTPTRARRPVAPDLPSLKVAVVMPTLGRREVVSQTIRRLVETQTLKPSSVIISCVSPDDAGDAADLPGVRVLVGRKGLPAQRNTALAALPDDTDIVAFFDDDFVADPDWLAAAARTFRDEPDVVCLTGDVLADGIKGPGLSFTEAVRIVENPPPRTADWSFQEPFSPYGCNMAFRHAAIGDLRFDERLVLYGWLEDRDFGGALAKRGGRFVKCAAARGVHMGVKGGRVAGDRLGYSQIVNPLYMLRKGTMTVGQVVRHIFGNVASNVARAPLPEPFIDRWGRLRGNLRGAFDVMRGRLEPERAAQIS
jgi:glycosyltransferase involved in cell wall biosynthesis